MAFVQTSKVDGGFEYAIGTLTIARSRWVKRAGKWQLQVIHMARREGKNFGVLSMDLGPIVPNPHAAREYLYRQLGAPLDADPESLT